MNLLKECVSDCNCALQISPSYAKVKCPVLVLIFIFLMLLCREISMVSQKHV